jgi:predicted TIM-barrel fold metal-dependent hydrolase
VYHVPMRIVTLEEHVTTAAIVKATSAGQPQAPLSANAYIQSLHAKLLDVGDGRIADMDASGISMQVLSISASPIDRMEVSSAQSLARDANDILAAAVKAHPDRFAGFCTLALQEPASAAKELERCVTQLGFKGVMVNGTVNGQFLDDAKFLPFFEAAQALDVPVYLHPAPPPKQVMDTYFSNLPGQLGFFLSTAGWGWHVETGLHSLRLIITGLFDRFPKLKVIIGHMGENLPFSIARSQAVFSRGALSLKKQVADYFQEHFWLTTSGYFTTPPFLCMLQVVGADRILFSVDYPFSPNTVGRKFLDSLAVSAEDLEKIAHLNAEKLLKL